LQFRKLQITDHKLQIQKGFHGQYIKAQQGRTQKVKTHRAQKGEGRKAEEAPRLRSRIEKAQGEETGTRSVEAVKGTWH
jgi:hypothetical protein